MIGWCRGLLQALFLALLLISAGAAVAILGLDVAVMVNGPEFIAKFIIRLINKNNVTVIADGDIIARLERGKDAPSIHIPLILIIVLCSLVAIMSFVACLGTCKLNYIAMTVYVLFKMMITGLMISLVLWIFLANIKVESSMVGKFLAGKMAAYTNNDPFNIVLDFIQADMHCCGFSSVSDWPVLPDSCCPQTGGICTSSQPCIKPACLPERAFPRTCFPVIRENLLRPETTAGVIGISLIVIVSYMGLTLLLATFVCCAARHRRSQKLSIARTEDYEFSDSVRRGSHSSPIHFLPNIKK